MRYGNVTRQQSTVTPQNDEFLFFLAHGNLSLGGLGYSGSKYEYELPNWKQYQGFMDEFRLWDYSIGLRDIDQSMNKNFNTHNEKLCDDSNVHVKFVAKQSKTYSECLDMCMVNGRCFGVQHIRLDDGFDKCTLYFRKRPFVGISNQMAICAIVR